MTRYICIAFMMVVFPTQASQSCDYSYDEYIEQVNLVFTTLNRDMRIVDEMMHGERREGIVSYKRPLSYLMEFYVDWEQDGVNEGLFFIGASLHDRNFFTIGSSFPERSFSAQLTGCFYPDEKQLIFRNKEDDLKAVMDFSATDNVTLTSYHRDKDSSDWLSNGSLQKFLLPSR